jgi:hypothetical protein
MSTEKYDAVSHSMTVRYWRVCQDTIRSNGSTVFSNPLSPPFDTPQKAVAALGRITERTPEAYICEAERFFNRARPGDTGRMVEFIARLH